jgi:hypothetical protein
MKNSDIFPGTPVVLFVPEVIWRVEEGRVINRKFFPACEMDGWKKIPAVLADFLEETDSEYIVHIKSKIFGICDFTSEEWQKISISKEMVTKLKVASPPVHALIYSSSICSN